MIWNVSRSEEIRAGAFVLIAVALLVMILLWVAGSRWLNPGSVGYQVAIDSVGTLRAGDDVVVAGVPVGKVHDIELRPRQEKSALIHIGISRDIPIHRDGTAQIILLDLLSTTALQVKPGSPDSPRLAANDTIPGTATLTTAELMERFDDIAGQTSQIAKRAQSMLEQVSQSTLLAADNLAEFSKTATRVSHQMEDVTDSLSQRLPRILANMESGTQQAETTMRELRTVSGDLRDAIGEDGQNLRRLLSKTEQAINAATDALRPLQGQGPAVEAAIADLRRTADQLEGFSRKVQRRPATLLRDFTPSERKPGDSPEQ